MGRRRRPVSSHRRKAPVSVEQKSEVGGCCTRTGPWLSRKRFWPSPRSVPFVDGDLGLSLSALRRRPPRGVGGEGGALGKAAHRRLESLATARTGTCLGRFSQAHGRDCGDRGTVPTIRQRWHRHIPLIRNCSRRLEAPGPMETGESPGERERDLGALALAPRAQGAANRDGTQPPSPSRGSPEPRNAITAAR